MQKAWGYISVALAASLLTLIAAYKFIAGDDYTIEIKKIKAKRNLGDISIPIDIDQNEGKEESRKEKREKRKNK